MNEPVIRDATPAGNAIVAYGETRSRNILPIILAAAAAVIVMLILAGIVKTLLGATLLIPSNVSALAYVPSDHPLPETAPSIWRETQKKAGPFPIMVGLSKEQGEQTPFAVGPRNLSKSDATKSWIWQTVSLAPQVALGKKTPRSLVKSWRDYAAPAWLRVWPERLFAWNADPTDSGTVWSLGGPIIGNSWKTDVHLPVSSEEGERLDGPNGIKISALPSIWPKIEETLRAAGFNLHLSETPDLVRWSKEEDGNISLLIEYEQFPTGKGLQELAGGLGLTDYAVFTLEDGTVVPELRLPSGLEQGTSTEWMLKDGRRVLKTEKGLLVGRAKVFDSQVIDLDDCPKGKKVAIFEESAVRQVLDGIGMGFIWSRESILWINNKNGLYLCW